MDENNLKYPIGVQSFEKLRSDPRNVYIDKTRFVYELADQSAPIFLSRPRRFGKSLLMSTLEAYFLGKKELFEGLEISRLEKDWTAYPVIHIDLNVGQYEQEGKLQRVLNDVLEEEENKYGIVSKDKEDIELRFKTLIINIQKKKSKNVVVLIDEYDKPLLECEEHQKSDYEKTLRGFYSVLKTCDKYIRFSMLTGVARFGKISVFSALNNLKDISLSEKYNDICGVTQLELESYFSKPIELLAKRHGMSKQETLKQLKTMYDGYHFSDPRFSDYVYNPFSLLNCFDDLHFGEYWFDTATPRYLVKALMKTGINYDELHDIKVMENLLKGVNVPDYSAASVLYQSGYLTIKDYIPATRQYILDFPNQEVKEGFTSVCFMVYGSKEPDTFDISKFVRDLDQGNPANFMNRLKALISKNPYEHSEHFEAVYHNILFVLFTLLGYQTESECHFNKGRADMVVKTNGFVYVFEFKLDKNASEALCQIAERGYDESFIADARKIFIIGVNFSSKERNISDWTFEER